MARLTTHLYDWGEYFDDPEDAGLDMLDQLSEAIRSAGDQIAGDGVHPGELVFVFLQWRQHLRDAQRLLGGGLTPEEERDHAMLDYIDSRHAL